MQRYGKRLSENFQVSSTVVLVASFTVKFLGTSVQRWMEATNWERHFRNGKKHNKTEGKEGWQCSTLATSFPPKERGFGLSEWAVCGVSCEGEGGGRRSVGTNSTLDWTGEHRTTGSHSTLPALARQCHPNKNIWQAAPIIPPERFQNSWTHIMFE